MHGVPRTIIFDRDAKFTSKFLKALFERLDTQLGFSTTYHPQTNGQTEMTKQILKDMLKIYVMDKLNKWEDYLHLVEFGYNNGYQTSTKMSPFEILYGKRCNITINWDNLVDKVMIGSDMLKELEQEVNKAKQRLETPQYRENSYANLKRTQIIFHWRSHLLKSQTKENLSEAWEVFQSSPQVLWVISNTI